MLFMAVWKFRRQHPNLNLNISLEYSAQQGIQSGFFYASVTVTGVNKGIVFRAVAPFLFREQREGCQIWQKSLNSSIDIGGQMSTLPPHACLIPVNAMSLGSLRELIQNKPP